MENKENTTENVNSGEQAPRPKIRKVKGPSPLRHLCRICLRIAEKPAMNLFTERYNDKGETLISYADMFHEEMRLIFVNKSGLPDLICSTCCKDIQHVAKFREMQKKTQNFLKGVKPLLVIKREEGPQHVTEPCPGTPMGSLRFKRYCTIDRNPNNLSTYAVNFYCPCKPHEPYKVIRCNAQGEQIPNDAK